jgi:uncharacterized damage-inducible protein DinB
MFFEGTNFTDYWRNARLRTTRVLDHIDADDLEWSYAQGKFTFGDLFRHLVGIERFMYAENVQLKPSIYPGHGRELADGVDAVRAYMNRCHEDALAIFAALTPQQLAGKCVTPAGAPIATWKWLRAMIEHEAHHRGQLYMMASMRGVEIPPLYGLKEEEVRERSR